MPECSRSFLVLLVFLAARCTQSHAPVGMPASQIFPDAVVVSARPEASAIGKEILLQGGNAVDAAVAVNFALAVCFPQAGNIGGGGFMVIRWQDGEVAALDFREKAPAAAHRHMYLDSAGNIISGMSLWTHRAVGVPGTVDGMVRAHGRFGTLPWDSLLAPAIRLAEKGFIITQKDADMLNGARALFLRQNNGETCFTRPGGWQAGDTLKQPELANTLRLIAKKGRAGFYEGHVADLIIREMQQGNGLITHADLEAYQSRWRTPVTGRYKDLRVISMPPPSSGGIALIQLLKMVEPYPIGKWGWHASRATHLMVEAERRVYADRAYYLGDPDFVDVPVQQLTDSLYCLNRMRDFDPRKATPSDWISHGAIYGNESEETTHFSIIDAQGNAVSTTVTLNAAFGSGIVVDGAGFLLNNEMDDFSSKPGYPNLYGLVGGEANAIAPGKRMLSSMTPAIVERKGKLWMVVGTPGGSTIITSVFQTLLNVHAFGMGMQAAVDARRFHHQWLPDKIFYEDGAFADSVIARLEAMGHHLEVRSPIGQVNAALVLPDGTIEAGADVRGDNVAAGY